MERLIVVGPLTVDEGPAPDRKYGTAETLEWIEEKVDGSGSGRPAVRTFYDRLEASIRDGAEVPVSAQSVRRQIAILSQARQQTGYV